MKVLRPWRLGVRIHIESCFLISRHLLILEYTVIHRGTGTWPLQEARAVKELAGFLAYFDVEQLWLVQLHLLQFGNHLLISISSTMTKGHTHGTCT